MKVLYHLAIQRKNLRGLFADVSNVHLLLTYFDGGVVFGEYTDYERNMIEYMGQNLDHVHMIIHLRWAWISCGRDKSWDSITGGNIINSEDVDFYLTLLRNRMREICDALWEGGKIIHFRLAVLAHDPTLKPADVRKQGINANYGRCGNDADA